MDWIAQNTNITIPWALLGQIDGVFFVNSNTIENEEKKISRK